MTSLSKRIEDAKRVYLSAHGQTARLAKAKARRLIKYQPHVDGVGESLFIRATVGEIPGSSPPTPQPLKKISRRPPVSHALGRVRWISVQELIGVWQASPFGQMRPPSDNWGRQSLMSLDSEYAVLMPDQAQRILDETKVDDVVWKSEKTDCDNIARYMAARVSILYGVNAVAVVDAIDEGHSYCAFLLHDGGEPYLRAFEPQTDQWRDNVQPKQGWIHFG
ncbi:MAG: hypothetical protein OXP73_01950 [Chloroflexota bacterium]|nr:hypothetical protein [Chloroflexota bacterium]